MRLIWINNKIDLQTQDNVPVKATDWYNDQGDHKWLRQLRGDDDGKLLPIYYGMTLLGPNREVDFSAVDAAAKESGGKKLASSTRTRYANDINRFRSAIEREDYKSTYFITKSDGFIRVFVPSENKLHQLISGGENQLLMDDSEQNAKVNVKYCRVDEVINQGSGRLNVVPQVLATITNNQYVGRSTIVTLYDDANKADSELYAHNTMAFCAFTLENLRSKANESHGETLLNTARKILETSDFFEKPWLCLSSIQLETLVAKLFEEQGYHVSSYAGGSTEEYDMVVTPVTESARSNMTQLMATLDMQGPQLLVQVKREKPKKYESRGDVLNVFGTDRHPSVTQSGLSEDWLKAMLDESPKTNEWLRFENQWLESLRKRLEAYKF